MRKYVRPLAFTAALGTAAVIGNNLLGENPPAQPVSAKAEATPASPSEMKFAVEPKPLTDPVKKGLKYLVERQNPDGGWSQGGGWRTGGQDGGRVDNAADPSDVGNTCVTLLALIRAGNTPTEGEYKDHVRKGLKFIGEKVEKADDKDLYVTDVRNTQLQSKIGPFVDTFLTALVLSEMKGRGGDDEKRLIAALDKTLDKMAKNQKDDGTFAGNGGWAPVLSQGIANKAVARAKQNGVAVKEEVLARVAKQSEAALRGGGEAMGGARADVAFGAVAAVGRPVDARFALPGGAPAPAASGPAAPAGAFRGGGVGGGDAGVPLYSLSQAATNSADFLNSIRVDAEKAKKVLDDKNAPKEAKDQAGKQIEAFDRAVKSADDARDAVAAQAKNAAFVQGFGSNGGEEFLSFLNISEMLVVKGDKEWADWDGKMRDMLPKAQDQDGSWSGHHCITGKNFCTAGALLVLMADRTPFPPEVIKAAREAKVKDEKKPEVEVKP